MSEKPYQEKEIYAVATDPIYIGTGGYTIGRVDNTIVRDPATKIPKIPGSSLAGTWRYYVTLELISKVKDYQPDFDSIKKRNESTLAEKIKKVDWKENFKLKDKWYGYDGNKIAKITCAGQDNVPAGELDSPDATNEKGETGHCGHCIVCKSFGYSKRDRSWQGMLFFSDLNILFFPVYTRAGVRWISSERVLKEAGLLNNSKVPQREEIVFAQEKIEDGKQSGYINLGWLNLPYEAKEKDIDLGKIKDEGNFELKLKDIIIVPDSLLSQIINSNLEVRTSVSINPVTGAAKEGALFTSEAIPRGTVFYGSIRLLDKEKLGEKDLPTSDQVWTALDATKKYYEILGIGGMTTRGFGRMKIFKMSLKEDDQQGSSTSKSGESIENAADKNSLNGGERNGAES